LRIAIAVHGRFYAFDLARALLQRGEDVTVFTNYPRRIAARFGLPAQRVRGFVAHGAAARILGRVRGQTAEPALHQLFGRWAARKMARSDWDATHVFSGVAAEWLSNARAAEHCLLARASVHIREQRRLLDEEEDRVGVPLDKPSDWMIEREEGEYERAGSIMVLSRFARDSFLQQSVPSEKLRCVPLAFAAPGFVASEQLLRQRVQRIEAKQPLRVLYVGTISYRKGMHDVERLLDLLPAERFELRLVGPVAPECRALVQRMQPRVEFTGKRAHEQLKAEYEWGDVFLLPSIEDGFPVVLGQATAAGLPVVASTHGAGPELIDSGAPGWAVPARAPERIAELLIELEVDRALLAERVFASRNAVQARSWLAVADDFVRALPARAGARA
jgi:glycosyltransferase involved in cell wall biosynthesis